MAILGISVTLPLLYMSFTVCLKGECMNLILYTC